MTFARRVTEDREQRDERNAARKEANMRALCIPSKTLHKPTYEGGTSGEAVEKERPVRSEAYRRLVAARPCKGCGIQGYSQAAHPPPTGKGIKESDMECFPLCCTRPGNLGCHCAFDQYFLVPPDQMRERAAKWAAETRAEIEADGDWPKGLPRFNALPEVTR